MAVQVSAMGAKQRRPGPEPQGRKVRSRPPGSDLIPPRPPFPSEPGTKVSVIAQATLI